MKLLTIFTAIGIATISVSSLPALSDIKPFPPAPIVPEGVKEATERWHEIGRMYTPPGPGWIFDGEYKGKVFFIKILPKRGGRPYYMMRYRDKDGLSTTVTKSINCKTWEIFTSAKGLQTNWRPIAPNTNGDRKAKMLCAEDTI